VLSCSLGLKQVLKILGLR